MVVAIDDQGAVVGIATIRPNHGGPAAHVANASFWVNPEHSGRGIGRTLGTHVLARARADGYRAMQFNAVVESNTRAVALWRSLGFEVLTTIPEAFHHPSRRLRRPAHHVPRALTSKPARSCSDDPSPGDTPIGIYCGICGQR
jgi:ribosomal protein S18 acetylase RimI-like enzyme